MFSFVSDITYSTINAHAYMSEYVEMFFPISTLPMGKFWQTFWTIFELGHQSKENLRWF